MRVRAITLYWQRLRSFSRNARLYLGFSFLSGLGFSIYFLFFNLYIFSLDYGPGFLGLLVALPSMVTLIVAVPAGLIGDWIGYKRALLLGVALALISILGIASVPSPEGLILFSVLGGLGSALAWVVGAPFMAQNSTEEERTHLFSVQFALNTFSGFFGYLVGGALPGLFAGLFQLEPGAPLAYRATLLVSAALVTVATLPLLAVRSPSSPSPSPSPSPPPAREGAPRAETGVEIRPEPGAGRVRPRLRGAFAQPGLLGKLFIPEVIIAFGAGLLIPYLNVFLKGKFAISDALLGALFAGQSVAMGLAILAGPVLADRWGKIRAVVSTQLASIPFLLMLGYSPHLIPAAVGFLVRAALMNLGGPLYTAFVMEQIEERRRAAASGLLTMSWSGSWALSNWTSGQLQGGPGFGVIFLITCGCYLVGSTLTYLFFAKVDRPRPRRAPPEPEEEKLLEEELLSERLPH